MSKNETHLAYEDDLREGDVITGWSKPSWSKGKIVYNVDRPVKEWQPWLPNAVYPTGTPARLEAPDGSKVESKLRKPDDDLTDFTRLFGRVKFSEAARQGWKIEVFA